MYVRLYVSVYVCLSFVYMYVCMYVNMCTCRFVRKYVRTYAYMRICMCVYTYACMCVCLLIYKYMCTNMYTLTYAHMEYKLIQIPTFYSAWRSMHESVLGCVGVCWGVLGCVGVWGLMDCTVVGDSFFRRWLSMMSSRAAEPPSLQQHGPPHLSVLWLFEISVARLMGCREIDSRCRLMHPCSIAW